MSARPDRQRRGGIQLEDSRKVGRGEERIHL